MSDQEERGHQNQHLTASSSASTHQHQLVSTAAADNPTKPTRRKTRQGDNIPAIDINPIITAPARRSARISFGATDTPTHPASSSEAAGGKRKLRQHIEDGSSAQVNRAISVTYSPLSSPLNETPSDRKGKRRAAQSPTPRDPSSELSDAPPTKRSRKSAKTSSSEERYSLRNKGKATEDRITPAAGSSKGKTSVNPPTKGDKPVKKMSKRGGGRAKRGAATPTERSKKGDASAKHLVGDSMHADDWMDEPETSRSRVMGGDSSQEDERMDISGHDEDDEENSEDDDEDMGRAQDRGGAGNDFARHARESGLLDEATAAAIFGSGGFRAFGGMMSGLTSRFKRLRNELRSRSTVTRLSALRECSELLLVSNEDTLGGAFSTNQFASEFIAILKGQPNIDDKADADEASRPKPDDMDEDAQLAAALAMSTGGALPAGFGDDDEMECQLVACRCLAHLLEALPGSGHTLVHLGAVPVLCSKLNAIEYIELAEQTLSTMEKISAEVPSAIVKEGGLGALLNYLPFFSTNVQRTAVTAAANCCRNISSDNFTQIRDVFPILRETLTQADQRLVEQATLAVVRTIEAYRHNASHLEGLLDVPTVVAVNSLLMPSGGSPLLSPSTYTHLLRALTTSARGSAKVAIAFLEAGMTNTIYQILTGVLPSSHDEDEQGAAEGGQGLAGGVADMAVLQNLAHRPKDQVEESLALICELLPPAPRDGVFDSRNYTERNLARIKRGRRGDRAERSTRRSSRVADASTPGSTGDNTPTNGTVALPVPGQGPETSTADPHASLREATQKAKRDAESQIEQRTELFKAQPELLAKFIKAIVPVLVDVYAASVAQRVRTKVLTGLTKAVAFADAEPLRATLKSVPMASFLCAILSSKDNPTFVLSALQLVELLATKLSDVYRVSFQREGVVFEIEALANMDLSTAKQPEPEVKTERLEASLPAAGSSASAPAGPSGPLADDLKPLLAASGYPSSQFPSFLLDYAASGAGGSPSAKRSSSHVDPQDANILRARCLTAKKIFSNDEDDASASAVLDEVASLVKRLCVAEASEGEIRDTLRDITKQFTSPGQALSSFELLKSGLVDGLLEFVDIDGTVSSTDRRAMLFDVFSTASSTSLSPLTLLVKRLHESLGRLEDFQVETAFNGAVDASRGGSGVSRSMRVRLQAEDGQDIPKHISSLAVTVQAIAPLSALNDYLRPRIADANYGHSALSGMFAAMASASGVARGGAGETSASRLFNALSAAHAATSDGGQSRLPAPTAQAPAAAATPADASAGGAPQPTRRRSARLSGVGAEVTGGEGGEINEPTATAAAADPDSSGRAVATTSILQDMAMDMDFEDEYTDEEYDAEVFEDEMEEELNRPQEKVVNMSVAADGSRVEAKTPEGTRIATPSHAATQAAAPATTGTDSPKTGSYAGAVKTSPTDFHIEFTHNGQVVSLDETIYSVVHKNSRNDASASMGSYGSSVLFKFRKVEGPAPTGRESFDAPSPASASSSMPAALDATTPTSKILRLLRVLHNLSADAVEPAVSVDENLFVNNKLTAKLTRQLEEIMIIASKCLPDWAIELPKHFSFLFPFETRYAFLQSTSFGYSRLISLHQSTQNNRNNRARDDLSHLARLVRQKVRISRGQLLESCAKVLELYGTSNGILEVEYFDEIGTGLGPTLEFYSIASKEFARRSLKLWRDEDESKAGDYVFHPRGLYPAPAKLDDSSNLSWYKTLGLFIGRALLDSRIIDVNLNKVFLKLVLGRPVKKTIANLKLVDAPLARSLERLQGYLHTRREIEALQLPPGARRNKLMQLTVSGAKLADLSLDFTLPGYNIELKPGGAHIDVDDHNLEEYLQLVLDWTLGEGIARQVKQFQEGFSQIFSVDDLKIFSPEELALLFGNTEEDWSRDTLEHIIKADHGYNLDSRTVQNLIEVMTEYTKDERRQFLQFITGAPKLPIGGFRGLNPPFTVVRKPHEAPFRADDYLPSVMTCAQYLKLPDYSTKEALAAQLQRAILDGGGSFHLS